MVDWVGIQEDTKAVGGVGDGKREHEHEGDLTKLGDNRKEDIYINHKQFLLASSSTTHAHNTHTHTHPTTTIADDGRARCLSVRKIGWDATKRCHTFFCTSMWR